MCIRWLLALFYHCKCNYYYFLLQVTWEGLVFNGLIFLKKLRTTTSSPKLKHFSPIEIGNGSCEASFYLCLSFHNFLFCPELSKEDRLRTWRWRYFLFFQTQNPFTIAKYTSVKRIGSEKSSTFAYVVLHITQDRQHKNATFFACNSYLKFSQEGWRAPDRSQKKRRRKIHRSS